MTGSQAIFRALHTMQGPAVLATLVRAKGSTYRQPGARLILGPEGPKLGSVSAGCLETDVQERVQAVLASGLPATARYDMGHELDLVWGTGMGCAGVAEVLLEPIFPDRQPPWIALTAQLAAQRNVFAIATVLGAEGHTPCALGDHFVLDEALQGLLPQEPRLKAALQNAAQRIMSGHKPLDMACAVPGGNLHILLEPIQPPPALWLYGAGEHVKPLVSLAFHLDWHIHLLDHRPALATPERFPEAHHIQVGPPSETMAGLTLDRRSAAVVLSHVYTQDREALSRFLASGAPYVGLLGNRQRSERIVREIEAASGPLPPAQKASLYYPVGLDLGAESPSAIALSILAEMQAVLAGRPGSHLKDRPTRIHG